MTLAWVRRLLRSRWSALWLAWALCLPVAQWTYTVHALVHLKAAARHERENPAQLPANCATCAVVAAIGGSAPLPTAPVLAAPDAARVPASAPPGAAPAFLSSLPYRSRAPPLQHA